MSEPRHAALEELPAPAGARLQWLALVLGALLVLQIANLLFISSPGTRQTVSNGSQTLAALVATIALFEAVRVAKQRSPRSLPVWRSFCLASLCWTIGAASFMFIEVVLKNHPYPGPPDFFYLLTYPLVIYGLGSLPRGPIAQKERFDLLLDVAATAVVSGLALWHFGIGDVYRAALAGRSLAPWFSLVYTCLDLALLLVLFGVLRRQLMSGVPVVSVLLLILATCGLTAADFTQAAITKEADFASGGWADLGWTLFSCLIGLAGLAHAREHTGRAQPEPDRHLPRSLAIMVLTYLWIGTMLVLLLFSAQGRAYAYKSVLLIAILVVVGLLIFRQIRETQTNLRLRRELQNEFHRLAALNSQLASREQELRAANETKDTFLSLIGHDLRNPLQVILLASESICAFPEAFDRSEALETARKIAHSSREMSSLLDNLLTWARSQRGALEFRPQDLRLADLLESVAGAVAFRLEQKKLRLALEVPDSLTVHADPDMLNTIVRNLVANAIKFTPDGGRISISARTQPPFATVEVSDTGIGLSPEDSRLLFQPGAPVRHIGQSPEKGTGLGLILCRDFVERHGGTIAVSSAIGQGSTFTFTLPLASAPRPGDCQEA